ncbi:MAG: pyridoxal phosphate-dependent aminotransferase family protein [Firmicutes bacterium]|jgi:glycine C-acetyltransferase|nr:pyridoxal phosphate-dependent aminotransferase family protein [Bacillota bacterium]
MSVFQDRVTAFSQQYEDVKKKDHYYYLQQIDALNGGQVTIGGRRMVMFSSYSYLGLLRHPKIQQRAREAVDDFGTGTHGVRVLAGTTRLHTECERKIADFLGTEDAIAYSSGYVANLSTISTLLGRQDVVITDKLSHASIIDGCLLSNAEFQRFKHNDLEDLKRLLEAGKQKYEGMLVIVDAVYSMDGDVCPLPDLVELCRSYGAWLMVDEAHSLGVLGETGHGILEYFGMSTDDVELLSGSLSKTIPAVGGFVAGRADVIRFLKHNARAFVFSAALPPAAVAAVTASLELIEEEKWRLEAVRKNIRRFVSGLNEMGYDTLNTQSCVIPIIIGQPEPTLELTSKLHRDGMFVSPILHPAVPQNTCRLRANVTAAHTNEDIDFALGLLEKHGKAMGII